MDVQASVSSPNAMPLEIGMLVYPGMTLLDLAGPQAALGKHGRSARYVTSVCSGSLLLGMAGLLDGYRAATHWACRDVLEALGVQPGREREPA